jgi:hypothetical protein
MVCHTTGKWFPMFLSDTLTLQIKLLLSFKTSAALEQTTWQNIPEEILYTNYDQHMEYKQAVSQLRRI